MRRKQLFALMMAGALSVGMAPTTSFAAENEVAAVSEETGGEFDASETADETPSDETPADTTDETPADEIPADTDEPAADPTETPADETPADTDEPAADPTETPAETPAEPTETPEEEPSAAQSEGEGTIAIGETAYTSLKEAFANAPDSTADQDPVYIKIAGTIEIDETIDVPANKNIMVVAAAENTIIKRADGFKASMFTVSGGTLQIAGGTVTDTDGTAIATGTLTVDGAGEDVEGSLIEVNSGVFGLSDGVTLTNNETSADGGAIRNMADGEVYLMGGTITGNVAASGAGVYSEGTVYLKGTVKVSENMVKDSFNVASNVLLAESGVIKVNGVVSDSSVGVSVKTPKADVKVVELLDGVEDVKLADVLPQFTYEGDEKFKLSETGTLISTAEPSEKPDPTEKPEPTEKPTKAKVTGVEMKWTGHNKVRIKFRSNIKGIYSVDWVKRGAKAPEITISGTAIDADTVTTVTVEDLPEYDVDIYVTVISEKDNNNYHSCKFQPIASDRPPASNTPTPTVTPTSAPHNVAKVEDSTIQGFEKALVFYPNTFYEFSAKGAGTDNTNPVEGDVRWVPVYWSMSSNPDSGDRHTVWKIGAQKGIYTEKEKTYPIYVFFQKQVYSGSEWVSQDGVIESKQFSFKAAPLTNVSGTPVPGGSDGTDGTGGDANGTSVDDSYLTPTTYAGEANGTARSAVSTGDESPIGTMMALAAASILAGGYVLVRRRKKEM